MINIKNVYGIHFSNDGLPGWPTYINLNLRKTPKTIPMTTTEAHVPQKLTYSSQRFAI